MKLLCQLGLFQPPAPVLAHGGGFVDAGRVVQPQPVLHGNDAGRRCAAQDQCDHAFIELLLRGGIVVQIVPHHGALGIGDSLIPRYQRLVVVGAGIGHAVHRVVVGQIVAGTAGVAGVKGKFQHLHAGEAAVPHQLTDRLAHITKVLRNDLPLAQCLLHGTEQLDQPHRKPESSGNKNHCATPADLEAKAAATSTDLATFQAQLAALRAQEAAELEAKRQQELQQQQQQKSDKPSSGDGNSTVTPTPPTTPDSGGDIIQGGGSDATHDELTTFAALLDCEAIHDYNSMLAVATVIMNRVESPLFPNSIHGVIYATGQFEPVWSGRLDSVLNSGPSSLALQVAQDAVNGARLSSVIDCYYFLYAGATDRPGVNVGGNLFFQSW